MPSPILDMESEKKHYSAREIASLAGINIATFYYSLERGHFWLVYSEGLPYRYKILRRKMPVVAENKTIPHTFSKETLDNILEGVYPSRQGWPTRQALSKELGICATTLSNYYIRGRVRGRMSLKRDRLHIHPCDADELRKYHKYSLARCAEHFGVTDRSILRWDRVAPKPFFRKSHLGRCWTIPLEIFERLKVLFRKKPMTKEKLSHLYDSEEDFCSYADFHINNTIRYNPEKPPFFDYCKIGMKFIYNGLLEGQITAKTADKYCPTITVRTPSGEKISYRARNKT